jgi:segregation and condensation protein B
MTTQIDPEHLRMAEALLFAAAEPLSEKQLAQRLPEGAPLEQILGALAARYESAGVVLVQRGRHWLFQTAPDLAFLLRKDVEETRKLSRAAVETLAVVAYHQQDRRGRMKGVSRAEIEDIRGVSLSRGTLDLLIEAHWVKPVGRRPVPGRPVVYGTTEAFLAHFGLTALGELPGLEDLRASGMVDPFEQSLADLMSRDEAGEPMLPLEDIEAQAPDDLPEIEDATGNQVGA